MTKLTLDDLARAACGAQGWAPEEPSGTDFSIARAILTTIHQAGYRIVPVEATEAMRVAGIKVPIDPNNEITWLIADEARRVWQAMLNAAPQIEGSE